MKHEEEVIRAIDAYADMVRRISFMHLKNDADVEDIFQKVFLKYALFVGVFENQEHEKAWFIKVTINACKDMQKSWFRKNVTSLDEIETIPCQMEDTQSEVLEAVLKLPPKYKNAVYLHYFEGYTAGEIGQLMGKSENTIYTWLARSRDKLKQLLGGEYTV